MRMLERRTSRSTMVLEDDDVAEPAILLQVLYAFAERPQHLLHGRIPHRRQRLLVTRGLDDDLMGADAVHLVEQPLALAVERTLDTQHGILIGHDAQIPARAVGAAAVAPVRQQLARRHVLM